MYQPISFNVIRQALQWHAFPVPTLRQLSYWDYDPNEITAEYVCTWSAEQLRQHFGMALLCSMPCDGLLFTRQLRQCFCEDVAVLDPEYDPVKESFSAILYVTISREVIAAANGDWLS